MDTECRFKFAGAVRALDGRRLEILAAPYGSPTDRDHLNEWFSARTDFMIDVGDKRPALYFHGFTPDKKMSVKPTSNVLGKAHVSRIDDEGVWMEAELKEGRLADRVWEAAEKGTCRASTGSINYLCRSDDKTGEVLAWPIAEISLIDEGLGRHPVNDKAVALPIRAMFEALDLEVPEAFGEDADDEPVVSNPTMRTQGVKTMPDVVEEPTVEEPIVTPPPAKTEEPKHRALFNVAKETVGEPSRQRREGVVGAGSGTCGTASPRGLPFRVLEEQSQLKACRWSRRCALDKIIAMRDQTSVASRAG